MPWRRACGSIRTNCGLQKGSDPARNELGCVRQVGWLQASEWEGISDCQRTVHCVFLSQGAANCSQPSAADLSPPLGEGALGSPLQPGATEPLALWEVHKPEGGRATFSPFEKCISVLWRLHTPFFSTLYWEAKGRSTCSEAPSTSVSLPTTTSPQTLAHGCRACVAWGFLCLFFFFSPQLRQSVSNTQENHFISPCRCCGVIYFV